MTYKDFMARLAGLRRLDQKTSVSIRARYVSLDQISIAFNSDNKSELSRTICLEQQVDPPRFRKRLSIYDSRCIKSPPLCSDFHSADEMARFVRERHPGK